MQYCYSSLNVSKSENMSCISRRYQYLLELSNSALKLCDTWFEEAKSHDFYLKQYYTDARNLIKDCNSSCVQSQYIGQTIFSKGRAKNVNEIQISYEIPSNEVQIIEEYFMFSINELIGTLGGHSGLFVGFSFYGFISTILEYIKNKFELSS